jgi:hypothetical protein
VEFSVLPACSEESLIGIGDVKGSDGVWNIVEGNQG